MQPLTSEQATFLLQTALPSLKNEHKTTCKVIEAVPVDKGDYRPDPVSMSSMELAWHIASAENMFLGGVGAGAFDYSGKRPDSVQNSADVLAWYTASFDANFKRLTQMSSDDLLKVLDFHGVFQYPAVMYVQFTLQHTIHHRGQLSVYLRPMGAKVPSIYGESYDAKQARMAAQV